MSLVKTGAVQVGQSAAASNNFHWRNLLDGLLRLTRGNAGAPIDDVMLVNADNSVSFPGGVASGVLGAGQAWQDVTASRTAGTTYTNSTGKPIQVLYRMASASSSSVSFTVNGVTIPALTAHQFGSTVAFMVPAGGTYSIASSNVATSNWAELR